MSSVFSSSTTRRICLTSVERCFSGAVSSHRVLTWIDLKRARWRADMSAYRDSTASIRDISRYSLYMLWVPERES